MDDDPSGYLSMDSDGTYLSRTHMFFGGGRRDQDDDTR